MTLGFDGASMGDIAGAAGVSKGTLYVYFKSKEELFAALIADERKNSKRHFELDWNNPDIEASLKQFGRNHITFISRGPKIQSVRTVMAIAERIPKIGQDFYRDGPQRGLEYLRDYFSAQMQAGRLRAGDPMWAARQFQVLLQAGILNEMLYGVIDAPDENQIARTVDEAVATIMARYGLGRP